MVQNTANSTREHLTFQKEVQSALKQVNDQEIFSSNLKRVTVLSIITTDKANVPTMISCSSIVVCATQTRLKLFSFCLKPNCCEPFNKFLAEKKNIYK